MRSSTGRDVEKKIPDSVSCFQLTTHLRAEYVCLIKSQIRARLPGIVRWARWKRLRRLPPHHPISFFAESRFCSSYWCGFAAGCPAYSARQDGRGFASIPMSFIQHAGPDPAPDSPLGAIRRNDCGTDDFLLARRSGNETWRERVTGWRGKFTVIPKLCRDPVLPRFGSALMTRTNIPYIGTKRASEIHQNDFIF